MMGYSCFEACGGVRVKGGKWKGILQLAVKRGGMGLSPSGLNQSLARQSIPRQDSTRVFGWTLGNQGGT